ncbi:hypothetical protein AYI68_g7373 [Smittium mucronatum]|uniref:Uncharacterized protein n=1 Tax=Smittium mucronatum TaxID=133383 RepID=A0A1R0GNV9_9FUNG|nr:hypothetical protein AYI68_g7373 [Smittium mucronatum]
MASILLSKPICPNLAHDENLPVFNLYISLRHHLSFLKMRFEKLKCISLIVTYIFPVLAQLDPCIGFLAPILPQSVDSSEITKNYGEVNPINLHCSSSTHDFSVTLGLFSDGDFFLAFTDSFGFYSPNGVVQARVGLSSNRNSVSRGRISSHQKRYNLEKGIRPQYKRQIYAYLLIEYSNSTLTISRDNNSIIKYATKDFDISQFLFSSSSGVANIFYGKSKCIPNSIAVSTCLSVNECISISPANDINLKPNDAEIIYNPDTYTRIPCYDSSFSFTASVNTNSDIFIAILKDADFSVTFYEVKIGIISDESSISLGKSIITSPNSSLATDNVSVSVSIEYDAPSAMFKTYINSSLAAEISIPDWNFNFLAFSAYNGVAEITTCSFRCYYSDGCH